MKSSEKNNLITEKIHQCLYQEMEINGISWDSFKWLSTNNVFLEIAKVLIYEVHEGIISSTGLMFVDQITEFICDEIVTIEKNKIHMARLLANGHDSFILFEKNIFIGLAYFRIPINNELSLLKAFPPSGGLFIQRNPRGGIKFFQGSNIITLENRIWHSKPLIKEAAWKISRCIPEIDHIILKSILDLAFHLLSPISQVGTTIVWWLKKNPNLEYEFEENGESTSKFNFFITDETKSKSICHYLSQTDGAIFIEADGLISNVGVHLKNSKKSCNIISQFQGTRHTSAKRFSFDRREALVITVSSNGPVSIFSDGVSINDLIINPSTKISLELKKKFPKKINEISHLAYEVTCPDCKKSILVDQVNASWMNGDHYIQCPVCSEIIDEVNCFSVECRPIKWLDGKISGEKLPKLSHDFLSSLVIAP